MGAEGLAVVAAVVVFAGGAVGFILQRQLPAHFTTGGPRDMIGAVSGVLTSLLALVLSLLVAMAQRSRRSPPSFSSSISVRG